MRIGIYQSYWGTIGGGQAYMGLGAEVLSRDHDVEFVHHAEHFDIRQLEEAMEIDLSRVRFRFVPKAIHSGSQSRNPLNRYRAERDWCADFSRPYDVFINCSSAPPFFCHAPRGVVVVFFPEISRDGFYGRNTPQWRQRSTAARAAYSAYQKLEWTRRCGTYDLVVTLSEYSRRWVQTLWSMPSQIVWPPLRSGLTSTLKENLLLSVGRFEPTDHKRSHVMIDVFKSLCQQGLEGWRYVLVGPLTSDADHHAYVEKLSAEAKGYPIEFRTNIPAVELRDLLGRAAVFWHATGFGMDPEREPGRFEHFGMVAIEAMAAAAVPVLFAGGGLTEIVNHGHTGFLWRTVDELRDQTRALIGDGDLRTRVAGNAHTHAQVFSREAFAQRWMEVIGPLLR